MDDRPAAYLVRPLPIYVLLALFLLGAALRVHDLDPALARTPDERTYTRQANMVLAHGAEGFRLLGNELAGDLPGVSRLPSPLRAGYITLVMLTMRCTGDPTPAAGAELSLLCSLCTLSLIGWTAYRWLSPRTAVVALLFYAVSPLDLMIFRRCWEESLIALLVLLTLALASSVARATGRRQLAGFAALAGVGYLAMTTKENAALAFSLCIGGLVVHLLLQRDRRSALLAIASFALAVLAYAITLASLFGGIGRALRLVRGYAHFSGINPYSVQFDTGPIWLYPLALFRVSPFLLLVARGEERLQVDFSVGLGLAFDVARLFVRLQEAGDAVVHEEAGHAGDPVRGGASGQALGPDPGGVAHQVLAGDLVQELALRHSLELGQHETELALRLLAPADCHTCQVHGYRLVEADGIVLRVDDLQAHLSRLLLKAPPVQFVQRFCRVGADLVVGTLAVLACEADVVDALRMMARLVTDERVLGLQSAVRREHGWSARSFVPLDELV